MSRQRGVFSVVLLLALTGRLPFCHASTLVYESFNYATGPWSFGNGGTGFTGSWISPSPITDAVLSGSLGVTGYQGTANSLRVAAQFPSSISNSRNLNASYGTTGTELWVSYLTRIDSFGVPSFRSYSGIGFGINGLHVGMLGISSGFSPNWGMDQGSIGPVQSQTPISVGQTVLLAVHMTFLAGADRLELYVNPTTITPPASPSAVKTDLDLNFSSLVISAANVTASYDEIRIGSAYADVVAIPEPTTGTLFAIAAAIAAAFSARQRPKQPCPAHPR